MAIPAGWPQEVATTTLQDVLGAGDEGGEAVSEVTIGSLLLTLRRRSGRSQSEQADLLSRLSGRPVTRNEISRWENEGRLPTPYWQKHTAASFGIEVAELRNAVSAARVRRRRHKANVELGAESVRRREFLNTIGAMAVPVLGMPDWSPGPRVGQEDVRQLYRRTARLRRLDNFMGGADTFQLYADEMSGTEELIKTTIYTPQVGRTLKALLCEQAQLTGWAAFDAGELATAREYYVASLTAAEEAGDTVLAGNALAFLAYQMSTTTKSGVDTATASWERARARATPKVQALLLERLAWSHAVAGQAREADCALNLARTALQVRSDRSEPDWVFWVDETEIDIMTGRCWAELHRPLRAIPVLESVLADFDDTCARDKALYTTWLARAYIDAGEIEQAALITQQALDLATGVASARPMARIMQLAHELQSQAVTPEVSGLLDRIRIES